MEENKERNKFCDLIEAFSDEDMYMILASFISADTLIDLDSCNNAYILIGEVIDAIKIADISDKKRVSWLDYAETSKEIILHELEHFKNKNND